LGILDIKILHIGIPKRCTNLQKPGFTAHLAAALWGTLTNHVLFRKPHTATVRHLKRESDSSSDDDETKRPAKRSRRHRKRETAIEMAALPGPPVCFDSPLKSALHSSMDDPQSIYPSLKSVSFAHTSNTSDMNMGTSASMPELDTVPHMSMPPAVHYLPMSRLKMNMPPDEYISMDHYRIPCSIPLYANYPPYPPTVQHDTAVEQQDNTPANPHIPKTDEPTQATDPTAQVQPPASVPPPTFTYVPPHDLTPDNMIDPYTNPAAFISDPNAVQTHMGRVSYV